MIFQRILFISILSFLICITFITSSYSKEPKAVLLDKEYNFGKAWRGDTVKHAFTLKNMGVGVLEIEKVEVTDIYTSVRLKESLQPGQDMEITLEINTYKLKGDIETKAILNSNDPANPKIEIIMRGQVIPIIEIRPMSAVYFSLNKGETKEQYVTIINNYDKPFNIDKIESKSNRFSYQLKTLKEGQEYQFVVKVNPKASLGRTMEKVTLFTNNDKMPKFDIGVNIFIKNDVYTFPDDINFGTIDLENLKKNPQLLDFLIQTILVKRREGKGSDFQIKLEHNIPFIDIKKDPESGSETYRLDVSLVLDKMTKGKIDTFIKVITSDKEVPELKIPVIGEII